jgi:hypothetical protein
MAGRRFAARFRRRRHLTSHGTPTEGVSRALVLSLNHVHSFWNEALPPQPKPFAKITTHASISTGDHPTTAKPIVGPQKEPPRRCRRASSLSSRRTEPPSVVLVLLPRRGSSTPYHTFIAAPLRIGRQSATAPSRWPGRRRASVLVAPLRQATTAALTLAWEPSGVNHLGFTGRRNSNSLN